jgi:hypothetical protein
MHLNIWRRQPVKLPNSSCQIIRQWSYPDARYLVHEGFHRLDLRPLSSAVLRVHPLIRWVVLDSMRMHRVRHRCHVHKRNLHVISILQHTTSQ